ncbi:MAG: methyltransferase domain-containing protein [Acidobacteriota bacterium]|nr:MAG: methyltransferase domain-containing protein [Acidobacteriota bacterium]
MKTAERFSNRVDNYIRFRPGYPEAMLEVFRDEMGLSPQSVIADIGCGPGQSSLPFLKFGCRVFGVEPNDLMRKAAAEILAEYELFEAVEGSAHATGLSENSVDIAVAAQAFHWFNDAETAAEFGRILKPGGFAALIWNERQLGTTPFLREYEALLLKFGTDYESVRHDAIKPADLARVFGKEFRLASYPNVQVLDLEGVKGRLMSSSYTPAQDDPRFGPMIENLESIFAEHNESDRIRILYDTNVFYTQY